HDSTRDQNRITATGQRENSCSTDQVAQIKAQIDQGQNPAELAAGRQSALLGEIGRKPVDTEVQAWIHKNGHDQHGKEVGALNDLSEDAKLRSAFASLRLRLALDRLDFLTGRGV